MIAQILPYSALVGGLAALLAIVMGVIFLSEIVTTTRVIGATFVIGALIALSVLESRDEAALAKKQFG